jgi:predicted metal-binding membrane protein
MWRHPEWWSVALSIAAWIALLSAPRHSASHQSNGLQPDLVCLMVVAMMFPLVIAQVRQAAFHSLWSRRHRAIGLVSHGYVVPWLAFGALVILFRQGLPSDSGRLRSSRF